MNSLLAAPYVTVDFSTMCRADGKINDATRVDITVRFKDESIVSVSFTLVPASNTATDAAFKAYVALQAAGVNVQHAGGVLSIHGKPSGVAGELIPVEHVSVSITGSAYAAGHPGIKLPKVEGFNGATGQSQINLPTSGGS